MAGDSERIQFARTLARVETASAHGLIVDRLCDALFDVDEVLGMLAATDASRIRWMEPAVRKIYDEINELMKQLCD